MKVIVLLLINNFPPVSIPYRFNERPSLSQTKKLNTVSIPYRFNESKNGRFLVKREKWFQFLIGSMKVKENK